MASVWKAIAVFLPVLAFHCLGISICASESQAQAQKDKSLASTHYLIGEMESLRNSLPLSDPSHMELTLRLADLYFDVSIQEGAEDNHATHKANRMRALELYRKGLSGVRSTANKGMAPVKIRFQMGRLLSRLDEHGMAEKHYLHVIQNEASPKKMREQAHLALAEWYDEVGRYKRAFSHYVATLELCEIRSTCNYVHYRKAWLHFKDNQLDTAIEEMKLSLWASDSEVRESSLTDLILFMSNTNGHGVEELAYIKDLSARLNRPELVQQLTEAYYVAGNRRAGSHLLAYLNQQSPNLYYETRLLEEVYGFRNWGKVDHYLTEMAERTSADIPKKSEEAKEVQKIFRRFLVQVDSEAQVITELNNFLKRSIDIYLKLYSNDDLRKKLQQGWLKAEGDKSKKVERLGRWIGEDLAFGFDAKSIRQLRQSRLSLAQELKNSAVVLEESLALAELLKSGPEADQFRYVAAREYYTLKDYDKALPIFQSLVDGAIESQSFGKWAILSQNLALDIFNHRKDYQRIIGQVAKWQAATANVQDKSVLKEKGAMDKILIEARFEKATQMEDGPESLQIFYDFCLQNIFAEKSCSNAKVLSVKFQDQAKLIALLEREKDEKTLMVEYELMGQFSKAAKLQEKLNLRPVGLKAGYDLFLKLALLYELDQNWSERNRILKQMIKKMRREKALPAEYEEVLFATLDEAKLIGPNSLSLPWSLPKKLELAGRLELERSDRKTRELLLAQRESQGAAWSKLILVKVQRAFASVKRGAFAGRRGQRLFKRRTGQIENFVKIASEHLDGADLETRTYLLHMLKTTYARMVEDILNTPVPPNLDEETLAKVRGQLAAMAAPFEKTQRDYQLLLEKQLADFQDAGELERVRGNLVEEVADYASLIPTPERLAKNFESLDYAPVSGLRQKLSSKPDGQETLSQLLAFYREHKIDRLVAYYTGRLENLKVVTHTDKQEQVE